MTPDEVKQKLLKLNCAYDGFTLVFSGKKSTKVNGTYHPSDKKIVINDQNFIDGNGELNGNALFYTAMHEFAHHIQTETGVKGTRCHTHIFYTILDGLAEKAEGLELYTQAIDGCVQALIDSAAKISRQIAALQKELGKVLCALHKACEQKDARYEDIVSRKIRLTAKTADKAVKIYLKDAPAEFGVDIQEAAASERDNDKRHEKLAAARAGKSVVQIKAASAKQSSGGAGRAAEPETDRLLREKERLEKTIAELNRRLREIVRRLNTGGLHDHGEGNRKGTTA